MKLFAILCAIVWLIAIPVAQADSATESVQQALKDKGFYYGDVTGKNDADTTAAIRRYQIRNGLKITGEINAETEKSLGLKVTVPVTRATPTPAPHLAPTPHSASSSDMRDDAQESPSAPARTFNQPPPSSVPGPGYSPGARALAPENRGVLDGTPYETAPPEQQERVIVNAQSLLARQGYYRSDIDGYFGPGMEFALRAYQTRYSIPSSGRLDRATLAALGLLPGQRAPGVTAPRRPTIFVPPRGERVYTPR